MQRGAHQRYWMENLEQEGGVGCGWRSGLPRVARGLCVLSLALLSGSWESSAEESNAPPAAPAAGLEETNAQAVLPAILLLEGQLRSNQLALEYSVKEAREAAARQAEMLSKGLQTIENAFTAQQAAFAARSARELAALQDSNRVMLIVAGTFAAVASLAMLIIVWFQWRMSKAWAGISAALPLAQGLGRGTALAALEPGDSHMMATGPAEEANRRLLGAMEQLERRIQELEQRSAPALKSGAASSASGDNGDLLETPGGGVSANGSDPAAADDQTRIAALLGQARSLLKANALEAALERFDEVLSLDPNHGEALVKKGAALERLQKLNEAFECYDRAIAADDSMTIAYLHKGGLYNRLERFKEALECYEKALRAHDERHS